MKIVAYYRVSTKRQGESGLGLEAQEANVKKYAQLNEGEIIAEFMEIESGRKDNRPELLKALRLAKQENAKLVVAKIDRLTRNAKFMFTLIEDDVDFCAADNPHINPLVAKILAVIAEDEINKCSQRTKEAIEARRQRGGLIGAQNPNCRNLKVEDKIKGSKIGALKMKKEAKEYYADLVPFFFKARQNGKSYRDIAQSLNVAGRKSRRGAMWNPGTVKRIMERATEEFES